MREFLDVLFFIVSRHSGSPVLIGGDFNSHIANFNQLGEDKIFVPFELVRQTLDSSDNRLGLLLAMDENLFIVLNGHTPGDIPAQITSCSRKGTSIIDLALCNSDILRFIIKFEIIHDICMSDHFPIKIYLSNNADNNLNTQLAYNNTPKLKWEPNKSTEYGLRMDDAYSVDYNLEDIDKSNEIIRNNIVSIAENLEMKKMSNREKMNLYQTNIGSTRNVTK